jgi:hypothetical protein
MMAHVSKTHSAELVKQNPPQQLMPLDGWVPMFPTSYTVIMDETVRQVLSRMPQLLMAWNLFVDTVREMQNSRGTVRKALSRTQHRQLAGAFDFYAKAVEELVAQRKTCNPPAVAQIQTEIHTCCRMVLQTVLLSVLVALVVDLLHTLSTHKHAYPRRLALVV